MAIRKLAMTVETSFEDIRKARQDLDAVLEEIRAVPGFQGFLAPVTFEDVAKAAEQCPLVYLAAADLGGLALIVRGADVAHVPLDGLTTAALRDRVTGYLEIYAEYRADPIAYQGRWFASLDDVTSWLWDEVMGPVLERVGEAPQMVLVALGLLGLLPVHAAWTRDASQLTGRRHVLDDMSVSYASNARTLQAARARAAEIPPTRLLAVAEPWPVPAGALPFAKHEALTAAAAFPSASTILAGGEATALSFEHQARAAEVLHLACHGFAELTDPLESGLLLADARITLRRLLELRVRIRLAVLSACETALPGAELPDEVIALPTGLLQAGVAGVVASHWSVPDQATAMLMAEFYRCWGWEGMSPATALRAAQRWLRDTTNAEKIRGIETAVARGAAWLPPVVAESFLDRLYYLEPDERHHRGLHYWAAFAHVGA